MRSAKLSTAITRLLAEEWECAWTVDAGRHHFDVIDGLADPASPLMEVCLGGV
ncbi:MAG: hypothetical protein ACK4P1_05765 [Aggregatilineales bacterium]